MRPRHCCRGRRNGAELPQRVEVGFNEAAALLPRKAPFLILSGGPETWLQ